MKNVLFPKELLDCIGPVSSKDDVDSLCLAVSKPSPSIQLKAHT